MIEERFDEYNTQKDALILKEYGRNVQKLVRYLNTVQNVEDRTRMAHVLINLMKQLNPSVREHNDNIQRIWDHLYVMADFELEINGPYPMPELETLHQKPERVKYNASSPRYKHYGRNVELLVEKAMEIENPEERLQATIQIAKLMKTFFVTWNRENMDEEVIAENLKALSGGKLDYTVAELNTDFGRSSSPQQRPHVQRHDHKHPHQHKKTPHHAHPHSNNNKKGGKK